MKTVVVETVIAEENVNMKYFPYAFFEGKIVKTEEAKISIMSKTVQYGLATFGGIRGYVQEDKKGIGIFRLNDHYERLLNALKILNKSIPYSHKKLIETTVELAKKNNPKTDCYFRPIAYANSTDLSPDLAHSDFDFAVYMIPLDEYLPLHKGLKLSVSSWSRIPDNVIPSRAKITGGYINSALAKQDAILNGFDDTLMMTTNGHIAEGSSSNFFMVRNNTLITPAKYDDVLEGITRRSLIELAKQNGIKVKERSIDRTEAYIADEAFLTGTGAQLAWVAEVDGRKVGTGKIGPITEKLQKLFFSVVRGKEMQYYHWLTKI